MAREAWQTIIKSKSFYIRTYRACKTGIVISVLINLALSLAIYYLYFHKPARDFYATSGVLPPIQLSPLNEPNYSETPLLENETTDASAVKLIPQ